MFWSRKQQVANKNITLTVSLEYKAEEPTINLTVPENVETEELFVFLTHNLYDLNNKVVALLTEKISPEQAQKLHELIICDLMLQQQAEEKEQNSKIDVPMVKPSEVLQ